MPADSSVTHLGRANALQFVEKAFKASTEGQAIQSELMKVGLTPEPERAQLFNVFSPDSHMAIAVAIMPFSRADQRMEGGLSISQGGHAQAVVVDLKNRTKITGFTHYMMSGGQVHHQWFDMRELLVTRARGFALRVGRIKSERPLVEITTSQVESLADIAFSSLLSDDVAMRRHSAAEITMLRGTTSAISEIAMFVLFRTNGSACCSCSCSCWGSSSCSCSYG